MGPKLKMIFYIIVIGSKKKKNSMKRDNKYVATMFTLKKQTLIVLDLSQNVKSTPITSEK